MRFRPVYSKIGLAERKMKNGMSENEKQAGETAFIKKNGKKNPAKWLWHYNKTYAWAVGLLSFVSAGISGSFLLLALVSKQVLDIATGSAGGRITWYCGALFAVIAVQAGLNILGANLRIRVMTKLEMNLRTRMFSLLLHKRYSEVKLIHSGEILNRFTSDIDVIVSGIIGLFPQLLSMLTQLIGGLAVLFAVDRTFSMVILAVGLAVLFAGRLYSGKFRYLHKEVQRTNGKVRAFLQECMENLVVIKSFVSEKPVLGHLDEYQQENYQIRKKRTAVSNVANTAVYVLFSSGYYAALVWGAFRVASGQMTFGTITALLQIINQVKAPFRNMSGLLPQYYSMLASAERLMELEELPDETIQKEITDPAGFYEQLQEIRLEHGTFAYEDGEVVLADASLRIRKGVTLAIAGPSGAGKSTLFKLLLSLDHLQEGTLTMVTEAGELPLDAGMRSLFSYVPQGNLILSGTIRENLMFGNEGVTEEAMREAARTACIAEEIEQFPGGYDSVLGERAVGLSEGQAQRIAIARALLSRAPILLLDECTSALDPETENRLLWNLKKLKGRTILCVSHKDTTIKSCDEIVRLENGQFKGGKTDED